LELHLGIENHRLGSGKRAWSWESLVGIALEIVWIVLVKAAAVGVAMSVEVGVWEVVDWEADWWAVVCEAPAMVTVWRDWTVEVLIISVAVEVSIASSIVIASITSTSSKVTTTSGTVIVAITVVSLAVATRSHWIVGSPSLIALRILRIHGGFQVEVWIGIILLPLAERSEREIRRLHFDGFLVVTEKGKSDSAFLKKKPVLGQGLLNDDFLNRTPDVGWEGVIYVLRGKGLSGAVSNDGIAWLRSGEVRLGRKKTVEGTHVYS
jgi:hypothetical protein